MLETDPAEAWGNAAIPGLRDRPAGPDRRSSTRPPTPLPIADAAEADRAERTFEIAPETLIVAAAPERGLLVSLGPPGERGRPRGDALPRRTARGDPGDRLGGRPGHVAERRAAL